MEYCTAIYYCWFFGTASLSPQSPEHFGYYYKLITIYFSIVEFSYSTHKSQVPDTRISHLYSNFHPSVYEFLRVCLRVLQIVYVCHVCIHENQYTCLLAINDFQ